jgi:hypothetical protein
MDRNSIDERLANQKHRAWRRSFGSQVSVVAGNPTGISVGNRRRNALYLVLLLFGFLFISAFLISNIVNGFEPVYASEAVLEAISNVENFDLSCVSEMLNAEIVSIESAQTQEFLKSCSPDST